MAVRAAADEAVAAPTSDASGRRFLGEILVERKLLSRDKLNDALLKQRVSGKRLGTLLVELGAIDERELATALGEHFGVAVVDLRRRAANPDAVQHLPEAAARSLLALPLESLDGVLEVAVADPSDQLTAELETTTGMSVAVVVASSTDIRRAIDRGYRALAGIHRHVAAFEASSETRQPTTGLPARGAVDENAPVVQVVTMILTQALRDRASDVHIEPMDGLTRVRFRIDGVLQDVLTLPTALGGAATSRIKVLAGMNIVERRRAQDGQFSADIEGRNVDVRVASTGTVAGEKMVLRLLDKATSSYRLSELGMPADTYQVYSAMVRSPFGMVICAGPTGSGKTTSLYATMAELNGTERNIMTIEDPVEYVVPSINQIQINEQAGVTFASGLRSILRQDPDIILVGEIRDGETARIAVQSALTGHFVMTSLHATDTTSALLRFLDMGIEPYIVGSAVAGVLSQRLLRRTCDQCRQPYEPTADELEFFLQAGGTVPERGFSDGEGCTFCVDTGYQDRIGVYELLRMTPDMRSLVAGKPDHESVRELAIAEGTRTLRQEAVRLVEDGVTTIAEVIRGIYVL
ncbi:MAG: type pilus assembly protein PilB [Gaiellales bacterium]|nr:type pilus assembly protein PilB [Actinomycetota bacterium]MDX6593319.1 type pilus assembly protein PilB [Gaiellales bacterium]